MKTAIYIEDGLLQVVLTPEGAEEKRVLDLVANKEHVQLYRGAFYACQGGWTRWQRETYGSSVYGGEEKPPESLIFVLRDKNEEEVK